MLAISVGSPLWPAGDSGAEHPSIRVGLEEGDLPLRKGTGLEGERESGKPQGRGEREKLMSGIRQTRGIFLKEMDESLRVVLRTHLC